MDLSDSTSRLLCCIVVCSALCLFASPAMAASAGLDGIISRLNEINDGLIKVGGALAVTGFIWALLAVLGRVGGAALAVTCLVAGLAIANAKQIVGLVVGGS